MSEIKKINFDCSNENLAIISFLHFIEQGYVLKKAYTRQKYFYFGKIRYFVEMELSQLKYKELIQLALDEEDYLEVKRLSKEYESLKEINFY
jgi:hypothetical protein